MTGYQIRRVHLIREPSYVAVGYVDGIVQKTCKREGQEELRWRYSSWEVPGLKRQNKIFSNNASQRIATVRSN